MTIRELHPEENDSQGDPVNTVEADAQDPEEEELVKEGVESLEAGVRKDIDAERLREAQAALHRLHRDRDAAHVGSIAHEVELEASADIARGTLAIKHADELHEAHPLVELVIREPGHLATWQGAIKSITHTIERSVSEEVFIEAAAGNIEAGRQRRSEVLQLGEWLSQVRADTVRSAEEVLKVVIGVVNFVASVMTILDHVPESVRRTLGNALALLPAIAR